MGEVYLARVLGVAGFEKRVVIKKILRQFTTDAKFVERFIDEGKTLVNLSHGNIVPVFDLGVVDGEYYLAMEHVDGRDLRDLIRFLDGETLPWHLAAYVMRAVCQALAFAHDRSDVDGQPLQIIHRDISPSNIMVSRDGEVKLVDFGIARSTRNLHQTISGFIEGKVYYMSPEQARGEPLDRRTDLFSLGAVFYEVMTGRRAFDGENELQVLERIKTVEPTRPDQLNDEIPGGMADVLMRCLERERGDRYETASQVIDDLQRVQIAEACVAGEAELKALLARRRFFEAPPEPEPESERPSFDALLASELDKDRVARADPVTVGVDPTRTVARRDSGRGYLVGLLLLALVVTGLVLAPGRDARRERAEPPERAAEAADVRADQGAPAAPPRRVGVRELLRSTSRRGIERAVTARARPLEIKLPGLPAAARVTWGGEPVEVLDGQRLLLEARGAAELRVDALGYLPFAATLDPADGGQQTLRVPLERRVRVVSKPAADVRRPDGRALGRTPLFLRVRKGARTPLVLSAADHRDEAIVLDDDTGTVVEVSLRRVASGELTFRFFPANARVWIDERALDVQEGNVVARRLAAGDHRVKLVDPNGQTLLDRGFQVRAEQTTNLGTLRGGP
jgi:tRNA A-37 threonylcarbamoyl transferase component Bud32